MSQPFHFSYSNRYRSWHGLGMNFHQLDIKTKEIMQNRQKEVGKLIYRSKIYHQLGAPGARAPYIAKSISLQIRNPN